MKTIFTFIVDLCDDRGVYAAFTSITGEAARLADLPISIAALLVAHGCNVGMTPVIGGAKALRRDRLSHVDQTYLRLATRGATWLYMLNDQASGLGGMVVAGTPRDSLYVLDVLYDRDGGKRPETIVTDTSSAAPRKSVEGCCSDG
ncbi:Tn3 family transposase [Microbispora bryophytorum]|uniref:Tn3 family transposase n=1 Tax=Microbispora bryophytorum TaxID=1460882 RepID=UPI003721846D